MPLQEEAHDWKRPWQDDSQPEEDGEAAAERSWAKATDKKSILGKRTAFGEEEDDSSVPGVHRFF